MGETKRTRSKSTYEKRIQTDDPDRYAELVLTVENLPEAETVELKKDFLQFWEKVAGITQADVFDLSDTQITKPMGCETKKFNKDFLYSIGKNEETGSIEIHPMNGENCIKLQGVEWVKDFIERLQAFIEE